MKERLQLSVQLDIDSGRAEFDCVVLRSRSLHWEIKLVQSCIKSAYAFSLPSIRRLTGLH